MGVLPPSQAIAHGHRAVIADHRERVEHCSCIETELRVQGEVYELPNWRPAVPIKRLEDQCDNGSRSIPSTQLTLASRRGCRSPVSSNSRRASSAEIGSTLADRTGRSLGNCLNRPPRIAHGSSGRPVATSAPERSADRRLMQEYGVARETARKAVRVLVGEGLVYVVQGRGAHVARH